MGEMGLKSLVSKTIESFESSLYHIVHAHEGGATAIAAKLGVGSTRLNNRLKPTNEANLNVKELIGILCALEEDERHELLLTLNQLFGHISMPVGALQETSDDVLLDSWLHWEAERGDTAEKIRTALKSREKNGVKRISPNEYDEIRREMMEDIQNELELLRRLEMA